MSSPNYGYLDGNAAAGELSKYLPSISRLQGTVRRMWHCEMPDGGTITLAKQRVPARAVRRNDNRGHAPPRYTRAVTTCTLVPDSKTFASQSAIICGR
jgi:hypothetical protein